VEFADRLAFKLRADTLAESVTASLGAPGTGAKINKDAMRRLLETLPFTLRTEREMELYVWEKAPGGVEVLVLDNELPLFATEVEDVLLRRAPTLKEMLSIRNAVKILSDSDVVRMRRRDTVAEIRKRCLAELDLSFDETDVRELGARLVDALLGKDHARARETAALFALLLDLRPLPAAFAVPGATAWARALPETGKTRPFAGILLCAREGRALLWKEGPADLADEGVRKQLSAALAGERDGGADAATGEKAAEPLVRAVVAAHGLGQGRRAALAKD
jgi:hypothetical protein